MTDIDSEFHQKVEKVVDESDKETLVDNQNEIGKDTKFNGCLKRCSFILEPMIFIFMLVNYPTAYIIPEYIRMREFQMLTGSTNYSKSESKCKAQNNSFDVHDPIKGNMTLASSAVSYFQLESMIIQTIPAIAAVIFLGPFSDKAGRKYALLTPVIGLIFAVLACTITATFSLPIEIILVGFFLYGCSGLSSTFYAGCYSYISDITSTENRSFRLIIVTLLLLLAAMISTTATGYLVDLFGFAWIFFAMLILNIMCILYGIFLLPETIECKTKVKFFTLFYIKNTFLVVITDDATKRRWKILVLLGALFTERLVSGASSIDTLFSMNPPLCWSTDLVGIFSSARHGFSIVVCGISMYLLKSYVKDEWWCILSGISVTAAFVMRYFVTTTLMMFGSAALDFAGPFFSTAIRAMLSKMVQPEEIGAIFGGVAVLEMLAGMVGHTITNPLYAITEKAGHPSAVYLVMGGFLFLSTIIMCVYTVLTGRKRKCAGEEAKIIN